MTGAQEPRRVLAPAQATDRREFPTAAQALRVAEQLGLAQCQSKVGRDPGKHWYVEMR